MDDNENVLDFQKMNYTPFPTQFAGLPANAVNQFAKLTPNLTAGNGQVVGVVAGSEGGVHYIRPVDGSSPFGGQLQNPNTSNWQDQQTLITLPITMPGAKPGDASQTVHIQVLNPNPTQQHSPKFQMGQMQIPVQGFQPGGTTVLTVAYNPQDGKILSNHGLPDGMTVVAALQPQDLQLLAHAQSSPQITEEQSNEDEPKVQNNGHTISIKQEPEWDNITGQSSQQSDVSEYFRQTNQSLPVNLQQFLKFNCNSIKYEPEIQITMPSPEEEEEVIIQEGEETSTNKPKRKRRTIKKTPKPKPPKPGQVLIATAIDGTVLFCCPECQIAYPEKENLERHLIVHNIERRYICDICGAGLKRKEHLERHKSGHNPDRPYICSVCMKGFKRKEHLNLHFVIHSGEKNEICTECGKGFYRKDHLRKHAKSHAAKRLKEEMNARSGTTATTGQDIKTEEDSLHLSSPITVSTSTQMSDGQSQDNLNSSEEILGACSSDSIITNTHPAISLSTVYVPTSDNTTLPVQIHIPQIITSCSGTASTSVMTMSSIMATESHSENLMATQ